MAPTGSTIRCCVGVVSPHSFAGLMLNIFGTRDQIIAFFFEYLNREGHPDGSTLFCSPSVTFLISHGGMKGRIYVRLSYLTRSELKGCEWSCRR